MSTVTKFEMDEKLSKMNNLMMSFMDYTNNKMKLMEEEIKQHKDKITSLENELNETKNTNQEYKHKIYILENSIIPDINRKLEVIEERVIKPGNIIEVVENDLREEIENLEEEIYTLDTKLDKKINENYNTLYKGCEELTEIVNKDYNTLVSSLKLINEIDKNSCKNNNEIVKKLNIISKNYNTLLNKRLGEIDEERCQNHNSLAKFVNNLARRINKPPQTTSSSNDESNGLVKFEYNGVVYFKTPDNLLYNEKKDIMGKINSNKDVILYLGADDYSDESEDSSEEDD